MSESSKKWYVLRAAGGKEKKAKEYLEKEIERCGLQDLVSQVLVPTEKVYSFKPPSLGTLVKAALGNCRVYTFIYSCDTSQVTQVVATCESGA